jgi:hypothetical protein
MTDHKDVKDLTIAELVKDALRMREIKEECEAATAMLQDELKDRLSEMKVTGMRVENNFISKVKLVNVTDVPFSKAEELGCVKTVADTAKLRKLYQSGTKLKGVKLTVYVKITEAKEEDGKKDNAQLHSN